MFEIKNFFPTMVGITEVDSTTRQNTYDTVMDYVNSERGNSELIQPSNENLSTTFYLNQDIIKHLNLNELNDCILHCAVEFSRRLGVKRKKENFNIYSWLNKFEKNQLEHQHTHLPHFISGVYYVVADEDSGTLAFNDPCPVRIFWNQIHCSELVSDEILVQTVQPKSGRLVMFPSWQPHFVSKNNSQLRMSIAFNLEYKDS